MSAASDPHFEIADFESYAIFDLVVNADFQNNFYNWHCLQNLKVKVANQNLEVKNQSLGVLDEKMTVY